MIEVKSKKTESIDINRYTETEFSLRHKTVKNRVKSILRSDKYARENDFYLCLVYWIKCGFIKTQVDLKNFEHITKPGSISRNRRELTTEAKRGDEDLKFLLNDNETLNRRTHLQDLNHDYYQKQNSGWMSGWVK